MRYLINPATVLLGALVWAYAICPDQRAFIRLLLVAPIALALQAIGDSGAAMWLSALV